LNVIHRNDIAAPARAPPNMVDRKLYHHWIWRWGARGRFERTVFTKLYALDGWSSQYVVARTASVRGSESLMLSAKSYFHEIIVVEKFGSSRNFFKGAKAGRAKVRSNAVMPESPRL
jgi:hypothetical protein